MLMTNQKSQGAVSFTNIKSQRIEGREEFTNLKVYVLYTSGSAGANKNMEIIKGHLKDTLLNNSYVCDISATEEHFDKELLITPPQQNKRRIQYKIQQLKRISLSSNVSLDVIIQIAERIMLNYKKYDAFVVLCGFDVICYISTLISFMFENLSKLIIFTGGYFPASFMRNDVVNNLIQSFAIISLAEDFSDVIIVCKNKGYRANRASKSKEGDFDSVSSFNLEALVSVNIQVKFRDHLFLPRSKGEFSIFKGMSNRVGIIKFHLLLNRDGLAYQVDNPAFDGFVIQTYGSSNIPQNQNILEVFKTASQKHGKIFLNVSQTVKKANQSIMAEHYQHYGIYFGGDMTTQAALAKLSYLFGKGYSKAVIVDKIRASMRGQLTQIKKQNRFQVESYGFMQIVNRSIIQHYPANLISSFLLNIQNDIANYYIEKGDAREFEHLFKRSEVNQLQTNKCIGEIVSRNFLLHKAVKAGNISLIDYFLQIVMDINSKDEEECSALYYALFKKDKRSIKQFRKRGGLVICSQEYLFEMIVGELKKDNMQFFELLYHMQFKDTLKDICNSQKRTVAHLSALLKAKKCYEYLVQKFRFNPRDKDIYQNTYEQYSFK